MNEIASDILPVLQALLSGFVATIILYWLSDTAKPNQFERVIQALICTGVIKLLVDGLEWLVCFFGRWYSLGQWTDNIGTTWSIVMAVTIGLALAFLTQHDVLYRIARRLGFTSKASVGEWRYAFGKYPDRGIVLNMRDGRRLMGYPLAWPAEPVGGHFLMEFPSWLVDDQIMVSHGISHLLIPNSEVQWVEFLESQET